MPRPAAPIKLSFRAFRGRDLGRIARLNGEAGVNFDHESEDKKYWDEGFHPEQIVVGEHGGKIIGKMDLVEGVSSRGRFLMISRLVVTKTHRGRGLGRAFVDYAVKEAKRRKCASIDLYVSASNAGAIALYRSVGFKPKDVDVHMQLELARRRPRAGSR